MYSKYYYYILPEFGGVIVTMASKQDLKGLISRARKLIGLVKKQKEILIVTHIDADGITSGAIAKKALDRMGIENDIFFAKQLDSDYIEEIADRNVFVWFTDLGSGQLDMIGEKNIDYCITDHHIPQGYSIYQLNPHDFNVDGSYELSGATTTYLMAVQMGLNYDLAPIAITGAVGDLQDSRKGKLVGVNREIMKSAVKNGYLAAVKDIRLFGKQTRPVYKMLEYSYDPFLPGISGNEKLSLEFMNRLGVPPEDSTGWRRWIDLTREEKVAMASEIVKACVYSNYNFNMIKRLVGETYILLIEEEGTELRDAMEFSTLLNATARYDDADTGLKVCLGDRGDAFKKAKSLLLNHRKNLSNGIRLVDEIGINEMDYLQYFHAEDKILDTIVGIVAGMCFSKANLRKPIIAFANKNGEEVKVSARATQRIVARGVNLANALKVASEKFGGKGGGHNIAAGATIPAGSENKFLKELDQIISKQVG